MGVDIYLDSIVDPLLKFYDEERGRYPWSLLEKDLAAGGGYFRNAYNCGDVMWAMELDWMRDVGRRCDARCRLPFAGARELVALIEGRPLPGECVARHFFENMTEGVEPHPVSGLMVNSFVKAAAEDAGLLPPPATAVVTARR